MILKFLHWNIWYKEKIENILRLIKNIEPDVFCLNELSRGLDFNRKIDTAEFLRKKFGFYYFAKEYLDLKNDTSKLVLSGIFSKFPIAK